VLLTASWLNYPTFTLDLLSHFKFTLWKFGREKVPMNGARKFRRMATESSDEWQSKVPSNGRRKFRWTAPESSVEWRPKVQMNGGRKFRQMAAESSDERRPKVPSNGCRKFRWTAPKSSDERPPKGKFLFHRSPRTSSLSFTSIDTSHINVSGGK